ncbi:ABC-type Mn/Zn transport system, ATPase component [Candidatus Phytoplasma mali]|uniref:ABC-type Mn/Zn transport system, ATPase component n=1 Tax=Phytoplasma mali (strain AT) TaxID=482235 RepID=B3R028_PHYMT|nr:metal ABC transporter ATP-binding protein [Candidatus Phytoplasma mali]CAP18192.1 ABC-type Mn/Zn transport system, ATPase component [Candidatus Phytoplasma mali]CAP18680.1 ABC-type Mn/Zn transport system, ATPase component [Candidatus Phytoplasma mali]
MKQNFIDIKDLTVAYESKPVLWDIDLEVPQGVLMAIIGPNGAGKSTLLKTMLNIIPKISGKILFNGQSYKQVYKKISYVPQRNSVDWNFPTTVLDVVLMGRYGHLGWFQRPGKKDKAIALDCLEKVSMTTLKDRQISELSGGQQQRIFLARALAQEGDIYLMDEPFQGVDIKTEKSIIEVLKSLQKQGKTLIVVHHDLDTVPVYFDHVTLINLQKIASGTIAENFNEENIKKTYADNKFQRKVTEVGL